MELTSEKFRPMLPRLKKYHLTTLMIKADSRIVAPETRVGLAARYIGV